MAYFQSTLKKLREKRRSGRVDANLEGKLDPQQSNSNNLDEDDGPANESAASHAALPHVSPSEFNSLYETRIH